MFSLTVQVFVEKKHLCSEQKGVKSFVKHGSFQWAKLGSDRQCWWNASGSSMQGVEKAHEPSGLLNITRGRKRHCSSRWKMHVGSKVQCWPPPRQSSCHLLPESLHSHSGKEEFSDLKFAFVLPMTATRGEVGVCLIQHPYFTWHLWFAQGKCCSQYQYGFHPEFTSHCLPPSKLPPPTQNKQN